MSRVPRISEAGQVRLSGVSVLSIRGVMIALVVVDGGLGDGVGCLFEGGQ